MIEMDSNLKRLDTLPSMVGARRLYETRAFVGIEPYYKTPIEGTIFLAKKLSRSGS